MTGHSLVLACHKCYSRTSSLDGRKLRETQEQTRAQRDEDKQTATAKPIKRKDNNFGPRQFNSEYSTSTFYFGY